MMMAGVQTSNLAAARSRHVLAAAATGIKERIARDGADPDELLAQVGIRQQQLRDIRSPVNLGSYVALIEAAAIRTGHDNFGLFYGQGFMPQMLGLIGMIAIASPNLGVALGNVAELFPYHQQATETRLVLRGSRSRLEYRILDSGIIDRRQDAELTLGMFVNIFRHGLGGRWTPEEIWCEHPRPSDWRDHERVFDAPVHFAQHTNAVIFRADDLARAMPSADLAKMAELSVALTSIPGGKGNVNLMERVCTEIRSGLVAGNCGIKAVSDAVALPRWTLQRSLDQAGLSFSDLVDDVRQKLAVRYLRQGSLTATEIAFLLGYSEPSAFSRAFKRWFGHSPQQWRTTLDS